MPEDGTQNTSSGDGTEQDVGAAPMTSVGSDTLYTKDTDKKLAHEPVVVITNVSATDAHQDVIRHTIVSVHRTTDSPTAIHTDNRRTAIQQTVHTPVDTSATIAGASDKPNSMQKIMTTVGTGFGNFMKSMQKKSKEADTQSGQLAAQSRQLVQTYSPTAQKHAASMAGTVSRAANGTKSWLNKDDPPSDQSTITVSPPIESHDPVFHTKPGTTQGNVPPSTVVAQDNVPPGTVAGGNDSMRVPVPQDVSTPTPPQVMRTVHYTHLTLPTISSF